MHVVALTEMPAADDAHVRALAGVLGVTAMEARPRLSVPGGGPAIVARVADRAAAEALAGKLRAAGFSPLALDAGAIETDATRFVVRRFVLGPTGMSAEARAGDRATLEYVDVVRLLRATGISVETTTESTKTRQFSAGRALLTGGLSMTKTKTTTRSTTQETWDGCLFVYPRTGPSWVFHEGDVLYEGLAEALQPSRQANFAFVCDTLRARCVAARHDDRLVRRAGQSQLLGPGLEPETHLDLALALLSASMR